MTSKMFMSQRMLTRLCVSRIAIHNGCISSHPVRSNVLRDYASSSNNAPLFNKDSDLMKKFADSASQAKTTANDRQFFEDATVVQTTGILGKEGSTMHARIGVFWGDQDEMNVYNKVEPVEGSVISLPLAEIEAVNMALRQAVYERGLNRVIIKTDSEFVIKVVERWLQKWKANGFMKQDGTQVKNRPHLEELDRLLGMIEAKLIYSTHKTRYDNDVVNALHENENLAGQIDADKHMFSMEALTDTVPDADHVIYASGDTRDVSAKDKKFVLAGYGVHWPTRSQNDKCGRFAEFPVTLFRAQMYAILEALEMAKNHGLTKVHIVTDSDRFLRFHRLNWLKKDGNPVANFPLYRRIIQAGNGLEVKYSYMPPKTNPKIEQANLLAEDGLAYPIEKTN